ncbi:MAG TPA: hypothetical protein VK842_10880 [bacterium]|jgi:hypothetical protein|nr:hypothetical protein [bacterium]
MSGWLAGIFLAWRLWAWLLPRLDVSAAGLYLQDLVGRLSHGGSLGTWDLPASPGLFPDAGLVWFCQSQQVDPLAAQRLYGLLLGLLGWACLAWLLRCLWPLTKPQSRVYAATGLLLVLSLSGAGLDTWLFPAQHGAAWLSALGLWAWTLRQKEKPDGWLGTLIWAALAAGLAASDPWFALWALPPLLLLALRCRPDQWPRLAVAVGLGLGLSYLLRTSLKQHSVSLAQPPWDSLATRPWPSLAQAWAWWSGRLAPLWPLLAASGAGLALWAWPQKDRHSGPRVLLLGWLILALGGAILALRLDLPGLGWAYPCMLPGLFLPLLVSERWPAWNQVALLVPLLASLLCITPGPGLSGAAAQRQEEAGWLRSVLAQDAHYGWAAPGPARALRLVSQGGLVLAPVLTGKDGVQPQAWCGDRSLWSEGAVLQRPQFVLADGLDESVIRRRLGAPDRVLEHGGSALWIYQGPQSGSANERTRL